MHLHRKHKEWMVAYLFIAPTVLGLYLFFSLSYGKFSIYLVYQMEPFNSTRIYWIS